MKCFILLLAICAQALAFKAARGWAPSRSRTSTSSLAMKTASSEGKHFVKSVVATLSSLAIMGAPPAMAANYGGFGSTYSEVLDPKTAVLSDASGSEDVKAGIAGLSNLQKAVATIKADLQKDNQLDLYDRVKKELNPGNVRIVLNKYNQAFSEDTQRGTDRLIRAVLQDITELGREVQVKPGKPRADTKVKIVVRRLEAAEKALSDLSAFYPR